MPHSPQIVYIDPQTAIHNPELDLLDIEGYPCYNVNIVEDAEEQLRSHNIGFILIDIRDDFIDDSRGWRSRCIEFILNPDFSDVFKVVICTDMKSLGKYKAILEENESVIHFHLIEEAERFDKLISVLREKTDKS